MLKNQYPMAATGCPHFSLRMLPELLQPELCLSSRSVEAISPIIFRDLIITRHHSNLS